MSELVKEDTVEECIGLVRGLGEAFLADAAACWAAGSDGFICARLNLYGRALVRVCDELTRSNALNVELLEACEAMVSAISLGDAGSGWPLWDLETATEKAEAAIAKAKGEKCQT